MIDTFRKKHVRYFFTRNYTDLRNHLIEAHHKTLMIATANNNGVLESPATVKPAAAPPTPPPPPPPFPSSLNRGSIGFIDNVDDGLISCTESLGFESSDERPVDDQNQIDDEIDDNNSNSNNDNKDEDEDGGWSRMRMAECSGNRRKEAMKSFPPPLSWLNMNGEPSFVLQAVRKNGRLELTRVRVRRPEILHATRQDGRLRLHLIPNQSIYDDDDDDDDDEEEEEDDEDEWEEEEQEELVETAEDEMSEEIITCEEKEEEEEEEDRIGEWRFPIRRCHEEVNQLHQVHDSHHHHHQQQQQPLNMCGLCIA